MLFNFSSDLCGMVVKGMLSSSCSHNVLLTGGKLSAVACLKRHVVMMWGSGTLHSPAYNGAITAHRPAAQWLQAAAGVEQCCPAFFAVDRTLNRGSEHEHGTNEW